MLCCISWTIRHTKILEAKSRKKFRSYIHKYDVSAGHIHRKCGCIMFCVCVCVCVCMWCVMNTEIVLGCVCEVCYKRRNFVVLCLCVCVCVCVWGGG